MCPLRLFACYFCNFILITVMASRPGSTNSNRIALMCAWQALEGYWSCVVATMMWLVLAWDVQLSLLWSKFHLKFISLTLAWQTKFSFNSAKVWPKALWKWHLYHLIDCPHQLDFSVCFIPCCGSIGRLHTTLLGTTNKLFLCCSLDFTFSFFKRSAGTSLLGLECCSLAKGNV